MKTKLLESISGIMALSALFQIVIVLGCMPSCNTPQAPEDTGESYIEYRLETENQARYEIAFWSEKTSGYTRPVTTEGTFRKFEYVTHESVPGASGIAGMAIYVEEGSVTCYIINHTYHRQIKHIQETVKAEEGRVFEVTIDHMKEMVLR